MSIEEKPRIRVRAGTAADIRRELTKTADKITDLMDVVENVPFQDQFNVADHGNRPRSPTSHPESASGFGGAAMVARYSDPQEGNSITEAYRVFAEQLGMMSARMEKSEKAIASIAGLISTAIKGDAEQMFGAGDDDEEKDEKDEENTAKSAGVLDLGGVPNLMKLLSGVSRSTGKTGLANPPDMAVLKAGNAWDSEIEMADARGDHNETLRLRTLKMRAIAKANGAVMPDSIANGRDFIVPNPAVGNSKGW